MANRLPLVLSAAALVIAVLGGTPLGKAAYEAALPRNSVGTLQLKRNAVTSSKLAPNTVRTGQVVDGSLLTQDFKPGQIPQGPKGDKGDRGPAGPVGLSGYEIVTASASVPGGTALFAIQPKCPAGKRVLGGTAKVMGVSNPGVLFNMSIDSSGTNTNDLLSVGAYNTLATARTVFVQAVCATVAE
jgi:hypothetical protein